VTGLEPKLVTALGFLLGAGAGAAIAGRLRGERPLSGRRCARCGASLSLVPALPFLSWFGVRPHCPRCGAAAAWLHPALESAAVLIGLIAIFAVPDHWVLPAAAAAFVGFVLALRRWG